MGAVSSDERDAIAELEEVGRAILGYHRPRVLLATGSYGMNESHNLECALIDSAWKESHSGIGGEASSRRHWANATLVKDVDGGQDSAVRLKLIRSLIDAIKRHAV